jgi:hypothetical protein
VTLKRAVKTLGGRVIDRRTRLGKALTGWRRDLVTDLGGVDSISTQEAALVDLAVKTKLLLDSLDAWLLQQPSLIDRRRRCVLPVVRERQQLVDSLARLLQQLGLQRRGPKRLDLESYVRTRYGPEDGAPQTSPQASSGSSGAAPILREPEAR